MGRYDPLTAHLRAQSAARVRMSFADIEHVLGRALPGSAATHRGWWSNNASNNVMTRAWLDAGFQSEQVDLTGRTLVFRRAGTPDKAAGDAQGRSTTMGGVADAGSALFGWLSGTVTIAPDVDLGEPASSEWADLAADP